MRTARDAERAHQPTEPPRGRHRPAHRAPRSLPPHRPSAHRQRSQKPSVVAQQDAARLADPPIGKGHGSPAESLSSHRVGKARAAQLVDAHTCRRAPQANRLQHPQVGFQGGGHAPSGLPISHSCPNGSTIRPRRQPCSSATGDASVAPAATACSSTWLGSSTTSSVRLVVPPIACGLRRFMAGLAAATEKVASSTASGAATLSGDGRNR
jgi:hypothetical protein